MLLKCSFEAGSLLLTLRPCSVSSVSVWPTAVGKCVSSERAFLRREALSILLHPGWDSWDSFTQFRFSDEKDWEMDSLAKNQIPALFIDLPALTQSLQELPLHTRLNLEAELVQVTLPVELPSVTVPHRTDSTLTTGLKAPQAGRESNLSISCSVKPVSSTTPSLGVSTAIPPATDDADQELDLLLNLQKPVTEMTLVESHTTTDDVLNNPTQGSEEERKDQKADMKETKPEVESEAKPTRQDVTEEDLEDWLDSMIS
ncbi:Cell death regulator Aven [Labeo rohita]|uniref:Cell death regulator Aven n=1 Tax=Labeo rohita TaxID=84645 RepID=A0ABQ8LQ29_LABRO|nr:Cell death regulator Aven [Labeo rohita]